MQRDKETVYEFLTDKLSPFAQKLSLTDQVDLDGRLWAIAGVLSDEQAANMSVDKA